MLSVDVIDEHLKTNAIIGEMPGNAALKGNARAKRGVYTIPASFSTDLR